MLNAKTLSFLLLISHLVAVPLDRVYVGELQERWNFPSDHLPIAISIQDARSCFRIVSWNVLNSAYMKWIDDNSQGLARSNITKDNFPIKENGLTLREQHVIELLLNWVQSPANLISLQECSELFIQELTEQLPPHMKVVRSSDSPTKNQNILLYDANLFQFVSKALHMNVFSSEPSRPLMDVVLAANGTHYRIFNAHLRCVSQGQHSDLAQFISTHTREEEVTIALGDLNVDQKQMSEAFGPSFLSFSPYKTTVSPELESKAVDHIFLCPGKNSVQASESSANELLEGMQPVVDLLDPILHP